MRKRTRHRKNAINLNIIAFICTVLSIIIVLSVFFTPSRVTEIQNNTETAVSEAETVKTDTEKNRNDIKNASSIFSFGYNDITKAENAAAELLKTASDDGKIYSEDYSFKNATASAGNIYIRNTTKDHNVNIEKYLNKDIFATVKNKNDPVVLVYHTHTSEGYQVLDNPFYSASLEANAETLGVLRAGDALCSTIEKNGYNVIHDRTVYDTSNSGAFERSRARVGEILRDNPSVQIVIDLHRDSISRKDGSKIKTVTEINGKKVAQLEITAGCEDSLVTGFPNWEKNLTFALHLQKAIADDYPSAVRPLLFTARKYNMDLVPCAVNVNIGTEANTVREAVYSAEILGEAVVKIIKECEKK